MSAGNYFAYPILNLNQFLHCLVSLVQSVNWLWARDANKFWIVKDVKSFNKSLAPWISTIVWLPRHAIFWKGEISNCPWHHRAAQHPRQISLFPSVTAVVSAVDAVVVAQDDKEWTGKLWCDDVVSESDMSHDVWSVMAHDPDSDHAAEPFIITIHKVTRSNYYHLNRHLFSVRYFLIFTLPYLVWRQI